CAAGMRSVTKLIKYEVARKVPTYTWKVEYCCDGCRSKLASGEASGGTPYAPNLGPAQDATAGRGPTLAANTQSADRTSSGVEPASYQSPEAAPKHSLPWDKMFK